MSNSLEPQRGPARLLYPWDFPDKNTGVACHFLLQRISLIQGSNPGLLHCRQILYQLSYQGSTNMGASYVFSSVQLSSVAQSCPTLCDPMNRNMPGLPVQHQLPEFTQNHVHQVSDAIQPSHPWSSPSPAAPNPFQHQTLFQ